MNIRIQSIHFDATEELKEFINKKVNKLLQFNDSILEAEVVLRAGKPQIVDNKEVEIRLHVPGHNVFAKKNAKSFEEAVETVASALRRQLKKLKE